MHVFFSGIGGAGIGPLALIAQAAGYEVSGSDKQDSHYTAIMREHDITVTIGQNADAVQALHAKKPIDWLVYSSAVEKENSDHPELQFAKDAGIKLTKRDAFINEFLTHTSQKMVAIAGTHGKTTTVAMTVWLFKQLGLPISYSLGAEVSFGDMAEYNPDAEYFVYEADEYDRNFLAFKPFMSLISGIGYDHPDIYPSEDEYNSAFRTFIGQSEWTIAHSEDLDRLSLQSNWQVFSPDTALDDAIHLTGEVNRKNARLVVQGVSELAKKPYTELTALIDQFPGVSRRFEKIANNIYTDYAHTPEKIRGAVQIAREVSNNVVIIYEGLHNTRQHFIKDQLKDLFRDIKKLYIVPSYLAREDESLEMLTPEKLCELIQEPTDREPAQLDDALKEAIVGHAQAGDTVLCLSAGGGKSLDEWLRASFAVSSK